MQTIPRDWFTRIWNGGNINFEAIEIEDCSPLWLDLLTQKLDSAFLPEGFMAVELDVEAFAEDYCEGIPDRELLARHGVSAKELIAVVKKLIQEGRITKEQYFDRTRKIQERETRQEKDFLKSLYHCPVCSHIQPVPFQHCPACGHDLNQPVRVGEPPAPREPKPIERVAEPLSAAPESGLESIVTAEATAVMVKEVPEVFQEMLGTRLDSVSVLGGAPDELASCEYHLTGILTAGLQAAMFKAESSSPNAPEIAVKMFNPELVPTDEMDEVANGIVTIQAAMSETNILKVLGSAVLESNPALMYEYVPITLEALVEREPEGINLDIFPTILAQMLNALGYSHMHRGTDGEIRRVPHLNLKLSSFFFSEDSQTVKLEGCGVWSSFVAVRGHKKRLWQEPGIDLPGLAPEAFVMHGRSVNPFLADMYALGAVLYRLATGQPPFIAADVKEYRFAHLRKFPVPPKVCRYTVPSWLDAMILRCLEKEPDKRWRSATQMELEIGKDFRPTGTAKRR